MINLSHTKPLRIALTAGEPAGIGPDIVLKTLAQHSFAAELVVIANTELLLQRAQILGIAVSVKPVDFNQPPNAHQPGQLVLWDVPLNKPIFPGVLEPANASYILQTLTLAAQNCLQKQFSAMVTAPVHKGVINQAGINFTGHTEFLAEICHSKTVVMMLVADSLRVALATTHLPLQQVPTAINASKLKETLIILHCALQQQFKIQQPKILVAGLNPHAGEGGHLGTEEIEIINPTLAQLQAQGMNLIGPLPADTLFTPKYLSQADAVLCMYHDQGLPVLKYAGFGNAVNITLGLPIIRTSVDHGTALDLAGSGKADNGSLLAALQLAIQLSYKSL